MNREAMNKLLMEAVGEHIAATGKVKEVLERIAKEKGKAFTKSLEKHYRINGEMYYPIHANIDVNYYDYEFAYDLDLCRKVKIGEAAKKHSKLVERYNDIIADNSAGVYLSTNDFYHSDFYRAYIEKLYVNGLHVSFRYNYSLADITTVDFMERGIVII